jgi:hypothetical protein
MPYRSDWIEPEIALEHGGLFVLHTYKNDDVESGTSGVFFRVSASNDSVDLATVESEQDSFDVREIPDPPTGPKLSDHPPYLSGKTEEERAQLQPLWTAWHNGGELAATENTLRYAIDQGWLTADGLSLPERVG